MGTETSIFKFIFSAIVVVILSGCSSLVITVCEPEPYAGTRFNTEIINPSEGVSRSDTGPDHYTALAVIDFIPSVFLDTLLLVYTVPYITIYEEQERRKCFDGVSL